LSAVENKKNKHSRDKTKIKNRQKRNQKDQPKKQKQNEILYET
jgi:hypothetical protein